MKNFSYLTTIAATAMAVAVPVTAGAQGIFQKNVPSANPDANTTTIDPTITAPPTTTVPSMPNGYTTDFNTTTTTVSPNTYPGNRSFGKFSNYGSFSRYKRSGNISSPFSRKPYKQQKVILNPDPMYPGFSRPTTTTTTTTTTTYGNSRNNSNYGGYGNSSGFGRSKSSTSCSTSVIGSPIPSAVPLDRSGRPCN